MFKGMVITMMKLSKLTVILENITTIIFLLLFACVLLQIGYRYFNFSVPWTEELSRVSLVWSVFLGSIVALINKDHIRVDIIDQRLSIKGKQIYDIITDILILLFTICLVIGSFKAVLNNQNVSLLTIKLSVANGFYLAALISSFLITCVLLLRIIQGIVAYKKGVA